MFSRLCTRFCASFWYMTVEEKLKTMVLQPLGWGPSLFSEKKIMIVHGFNKEIKNQLILITLLLTLKYNTYM